MFLALFEPMFPPFVFEDLLPRSPCALLLQQGEMNTGLM
jgi:hypothetical protein